MKISDSLLREARRLTARAALTLRALVGRRLRRVIAESTHRAPFKLRRISFSGKGLRPELQHAPWDKLRDLVYDDHGA